MSGTVRHARLESRSSRARLKRGRQPHWQNIIPGRVHLGFQRRKEEPEGRWLLRRYSGGKYGITAIGLADDCREADGERVYDYGQAHAFAVAAAETTTGKRKPAIKTVRDAFHAYVEHKKNQGQPVRDLLSRGNAHILPALGDVVAADLTSERIRKWLATLAAMPAMVRSKKDGKQNYKAEPCNDDAIRARRSSTNRVLTMLKSALNHAYDEGHVASNEAWGRRVKPFREVDIARVRYLAIAEAMRLMNAADSDFRFLIQAALQTGARYGELTRLEVADFNPDTGTVAIRKSKTGKARHVILTDEGAAFFRKVTAGRAGNKTIFLRADGTPWKSSQQARPMREAAERAKINPLISFHGLRHTWASLSVMAGVPLMVVAKNLGHVDTRMVERHYGHLAPSFIVDAIRANAPRFGFKLDGKVVPLTKTK